MKILYQKKWKKSIIIPILKPGENPKSPSSYRPISLLSCLGKLMEKIIKKKIINDTQKIIQPEQCGFYKGRSTLDALLRMEHTIKKGFSNNQVTCAIFFDAAAAFDRVDLQILKNKINSLHIDIQLKNWIQNWISDRKFCVRTHCVLSSERNIKAGVPQGGVLSSILFSLYVSDLTTDHLQRTNLYMYADDITITITGNSMDKIKTSGTKSN